MSDTAGGSGGDCRRRVQDVRLVERALCERWPIPKALRRPLIDRLGEIVQDPDATPREITSAARAILTASKINLETITATIKADEHETLVERVEELEKRQQQKEL